MAQKVSLPCGIFSSVELRTLHKKVSNTNSSTESNRLTGHLPPPSCVHTNTGPPAYLGHVQDLQREAVDARRVPLLAVHLGSLGAVGAVLLLSGRGQHGLQHGLLPGLGGRGAAPRRPAHIARARPIASPRRAAARLGRHRRQQHGLLGQGPAAQHRVRHLGRAVPHRLGATRAPLRRRPWGDREGRREVSAPRPARPATAHPEPRGRTCGKVRAEPGQRQQQPPHPHPQPRPLQRRRVSPDNERFRRIPGTLPVPLPCGFPWEEPSAGGGVVG